MRTLKVVLFIFFVLMVILGLIGLLSPSTVASIGWAAEGADAYTRVVATGTISFALATWFAFRDPVRNEAILLVLIAWLGLQGLVLLISGIAGTFEWGTVLPGVIFDWAIAVLLAIFYPRRAKTS